MSTSFATELVTVNVLEAEPVTVTVNFVAPGPVSVIITNGDVAFIQLVRDWENSHCMHISPNLWADSPGVNNETKS